MDLHAVRLDAQPIGVVDAAERERAASFHDPGVRHRFLAGRSWLRTLVSGLLGVPAGALASEYVCPTCGSGDHGRPGYAAGGDPVPLAVSLTRSAGWAVAALEVSATRSGLGVDLESRDRFRGGELDESVLTPAELDTVRRLSPPDRARRRAALWSSKEAVVKAAGTGFLVEPAAVDVSRGLVELRGGRYSVSQVPAASLGLPAGFAVAVAQSVNVGSSTTAGRSGKGG